MRESFKPLQTISLKEIVTDAARNSAQVERIVQNTSGTRRDIRHSPRINIKVFSPSRCSHSSIEKWSRNIDPFNTSIDGSMAQESNSASFYTDKISVKCLPGEVVTDLDPSKRMNFAKPSSAKVQSSWILGSRLSMQRVNQTPYSPPLPERKY